MSKPPKTQLTVAFLGPEGTHSHEACLRRFGPCFTPHPCRSFREALDALATVDAILLPVENSVEGPVTQVLDLLAQRTDIAVQEAFDIPIRNHLAARAAVTSLAAIRTVYSHPQVLGQCEQWLRQHLPHADLVPLASTAEAARRAATERHAAAIAGQAAIDIHHLRLLASDVQDRAHNATRFLLLTPPNRPHATIPKRKAAVRPRTRTLLYLILHNRPGSLLAALKPFDRFGMNLTFIQSRPIAGRAWDYGFFVEVAADARKPALLRTLQALTRQTQVCRVISSYACYGLGNGKKRRV
ncbi:MAG: prephenate dehydratase domain-containing protein [bacterium]